MIGSEKLQDATVAVLKGKSSIPSHHAQTDPARRLTAFAVFVIVIGILSINGTYQNSRPPPCIASERLALTAAIEAFKADNGSYPQDPETTDKLPTNSTFDPKLYIPSSSFLYRAISGHKDGNPGSPTEAKEVYYDIPASMLAFDPKYKTYIIDLKGNSFGYSTIQLANPDSKEGNNPTFDLWSTSGGRTARDRTRWIKNW